MTKGAQAVENLTDFLNSSTSKDREDFVEALMREHRELQQSTSNLFLEANKAWATQYKEGNFDARNEQAVRNGVIMVQALGYKI